MLTPLSFSINNVFWGLMGLARFSVERVTWLIKHGECESAVNLKKIKKNEICICMPGKNEEKVIGETINSLKRISAPSQIYFVSDGSEDNTVEVARLAGCNVLELCRNRGKARATQALIKHFDLLNKYKLILFVDADSIIPADYLDKALPIFENEKVAALAAYATTKWENNRFVAHRQRLYSWGQIFNRYGQSWAYINSNWVIPGFASIYRTSVLKQLDLDAKGIVTEDLYMTFEVHHKKLGVVYHNPAVYAYTQDPDNLKDYIRQIDRWNLGIWQTIRAHGLWLSPVCASLLIFLLESVFYGVLLLTAPVILIAVLGIWFFDMISPMNEMLVRVADYYLIGVAVFLAINYLIAGLVSAIERKWRIFYWELRSIWLFYLDLWSFFGSFFNAFKVKSDGSWISPERR